MFIKSTKVKDYEYINLVESYRGENGTTKHRVLYNFGRRDQLCEDKSFRKIVLKLCELADIKVLDESDGEASPQKWNRRAKPDSQSGLPRVIEKIFFDKIWKNYWQNAFFMI